MTRCAPRSLRTIAALAALLVLACGTARGPALSAHDTPRSAPLPPSEPEPAESLDTSAWTESRWLGVRVPATREELDDLELPSPHVASANGRVICLDLRGGDARKALGAISGPLTVLLPSLDPELVEQVNRVAGRFPVAVSYETPANLGGEVDLTPLSQLSNIQGLQLFVGSGELPDLRGLARLRWLELRYAGFAADSIERLPMAIEDLTYDGPLQFDTVGRLGRFPRLRRLSTAMRGLNWSPLDRLRSIEALELPDDITLEDLKGLEKLPHLRELSTRARLGSREFEALAQLRELRAPRGHALEAAPPRAPEPQQRTSGQEARPGHDEGHSTSRSGSLRDQRRRKRCSALAPTRAAPLPQRVPHRDPRRRLAQPGEAPEVARAPDRPRCRQRHLREAPHGAASADRWRRAKQAAMGAARCGESVSWVTPLCVPALRP